ncbi:MAG: hypothetical protein H5T92_06820 [Synergistales bacterium]|nr:hypothetical protein [Synergistales bacterium]
MQIRGFSAAFTGRLVEERSSDGTARYSYDRRGQLIGVDYSLLPLGGGRGEGLAAVQGGLQATAQGERPNVTSAGTVLWPLTDHLGRRRHLAERHL